MAYKAMQSAENLRRCRFPVSTISQLEFLVYICLKLYFKSLLGEFLHRNVLKATIEVPRAGEVNLHCTLLDHLDEDWRMKQIGAILRSSDGPYILAGGLNILDETDYSEERWNDIIKVVFFFSFFLFASFLLMYSFIGKKLGSLIVVCYSTMKRMESQSLRLR